jgi:aminoglycoside phosphotransferase (APT) family kinase protein
MARIEIDEALVRRLLAEQYPEWLDLPLRRAEPAGTVNAIFRLGNDLSVRLSRREGPTEPGGKEFDWLPRLAPLLPVDVPVPVGQGRPTGGYPWFWDIHTWVAGQSVRVEEIDSLQAGRDLAELVGALQQVSATGAPPGRGIPLAKRDRDTRYWLARFDGDPVTIELVSCHLASPMSLYPPVRLLVYAHKSEWRPSCKSR